MKPIVFIRAGLALLALCLTAQFSARAQQSLYVAAFNSPAGELYTVNPATGQVVEDVGALTDNCGNPFNLFAIRFQPGTGILYAVTDSLLVTIDADTAMVTPIGSLGVGIDDIAFDPVSGGLFGTDSGGNLCTIDLTTGIATEVGDSGFGGLVSGGFAINSLGQYFIIPFAAGGELDTYDPVTGAGTMVTGLSGAPFSDGAIYNLAFDDHDTLFGVNTSGDGSAYTLVTIDPATGQVTSIGSTIGNDGLAFSVPISPSAPLAHTMPASAVTDTSATLNGTVNPKGSDTAVFILWGDSPDFGNTNQLAGLSAGFTAQSVNLPLTGLSPATTYYFMVTATNVSGANSGAVENFSTAAASTGQLLYTAVNGGGGGTPDELFTVDPTDGNTLTDVGPLVDSSGNPYGMSGLRFQPGAGTLYGIASGVTLVTIDPATAGVTPIGPLAAPGGFVQDIAFDPATGTLYGTDHYGSLCTINLTTGQATKISESIFETIDGDFGGGLAIDAFGMSITTPIDAVTAATLELGSFDLATGAGTWDASLYIGPFGSGNNDIYNLACDANNTLYGVDFANDSSGPQHLITINRTTGEITDLGVTVGGGGLAFSLPFLALPPLALTLPATALTSASATLNGVVNPNGADTSVFVEWGTTTAFGNTNELTGISSSFAPQNVSSALTGLLPGTTYYFTVTATNASGSVSGAVLSFSTPSGPGQLLYTVASGSPADELYTVDPSTGQIIADVGPLMDGSANSYNLYGVRFQPGTGVLFGIAGPGSATAPNSLVVIDKNTAAVTEIGPLETYLSDLAFNPASGELFGTDGSGNLNKINLTTGLASVVGDSVLFLGSGGFAINRLGQYFAAPDGDSGDLAVYDPVTGVATVVATLSGSPSGDGSIYNLAFAANDTLYGIDSGGGGNHLVTIDPATGQITDVAGDFVGYDGIAFTLSTTLAAPSAATLAASAITSTSATLNGGVNPNGQGTAVFVEWGTTTAFGNTNELTGISASFSPQSVSYALSGLSPATTYYFSVAATNESGALSGAIMSFRTPLPFTGQVLYSASPASPADELYTVDPATGQVITDIGPLIDASGNSYNVSGLSFEPATGTLFGVTAFYSSAYPASLISIDIHTATVTEIVPEGNVSYLADIAFDPASGALFGTDGDFDSLCAVSLATGLATPLGDPGLSGASGAGFAINSLGQYFTTPTGDSGVLATYNPVTGAAAAVATLTGSPFGDGSIYNLAFDANDNLYAIDTVGCGCTSHLVTINPSTGQITDLGETSAGVGLAFTPPALPAAPLALTLPASAVSGALATARGVVNPSGLNSAVFIVWGTTTNFGNTNELAAVPAGFAPQPITSGLTGLSPSTDYYYTVMATNSAGTAIGATVHFKTPPAPATGFNQLLYAADGGNNSAGHLFILNPLTGQTISDIGPLVDSGAQTYALTGLRFQPGTGILYGLTSSHSSTYPGSLVTIDPATALVTEIGSTGIQLADLAFDAASGVLYGTDANNENLCQIDIAAGLATEFDDSGLPGNKGHGFAISPSGQYFTTPDGAVNGHLATYDPANGAGAVVANLTGAPRANAIDALAVASSGALYGINNSNGGGGASLVTIDPATGQITDLGATVGDLDGLAFSPSIGGLLVTTLAAVSVTSESAMLNGSVVSGATSAAVFFKWGTTTALGNTVQLADVSASLTPQGVSYALTGLSPGTTYFFSVTATNESGSVSGAVLSFTTPGPVPGFNQVLYAAEGMGNVDAHFFVLDPSSGAVVRDVGSLVDGSGNHVCLTGLRARPGTGILYALTSHSSPHHPDNLVTVDPATAIVTVIGPLHDHLSDLAFEPVSGALYGVTFLGNLCSIDLTSGRATEIGSPGTPTDVGNGFAIDAFGRNFTTPDYGSGELWTFNLATGATTEVTPLNGASLHGTINALAFDSGNTLFGLEDDGSGAYDLITINPATGLVTDVGATTIGDLDALAFGAPASTPAPLVRALPATAVTGTSATLNGLVIPGTTNAAVFVDWGTTHSLGNIVELAGLTAGFTPQGVSYALTGLSPGTEYFFSVVATNDVGVANGGVLRFTTPPAFSAGFDQLLYAAQYNTNGGPDELFILNPADGQPVLDLGPTVDAAGNTYNILSLRFQPGTGTLFGLADSSVAPTSLVTIDVASAIVSPVGFVTASLIDIAFDPASGALFGTTFGHSLYTVDPGSGLASRFGDTDLPPGSGNGFAINSLGQYFTVANGDAGVLATLNPASGAGTVVGALSGSPFGNGNIYNLGFAANNTLYGIDTSSDFSPAHFITVNTNTGAITDLGSTIGNDGLAFSLPAAAPTVTTLAATAVTANSATLNGLVNPGGEATDVSILWGITTAFGNTNDLSSLPAGNAPQYASTTLTGLAPLTGYYYTVVASNDLGRVRGQVLHLTTPPPEFQPVLYTAEFTPGADELYTLNPANGQTVTDIGPLVDTNGDFFNLFSLAFQPVTGTLFGIADGGGSLVTINPATAIVTFVGPLNGSGILNIAFDPTTGTLYGTDGLADLYTINPATAHVRRLAFSIFDVNNDQGGGLAINAFGQCFSTPLDLAGGGLLGSYSLITGVGTPISPVNGGPFGAHNDDVFNLAIDSSNTLYGVDFPRGAGNQHLVTINPTTGGITDIGETIGGDGLAFSSPLPQAPYVTAIAASPVASKSATLRGTVNPNGAASTVSILWGATPVFGNTIALAGLPAGIAPQNVNTTLTGLAPATTYYFKVAASNYVGAVGGQTLSFTTPALPPVAISLAATGVTGTSATLNGTIFPQGSAATASFVWGTTPSLGTTNAAITLASAFGSQNVSNTLTGLTPGTTYYYAVTATNAGGEVEGAVRSFTTANAPVVVTLPASGVSVTSATINGTVYPLGSATTAGFVWGASPSLGTTNPSVSLASAFGSQNVSNTLTGLTPGTTYYYTVMASNAGGTVEGTVRSFTTAVGPVAVTLSASGVASTSATLNGTVYPVGSATRASFVWGASPSLGTTNPSVSLASAFGSQNMSNTLTGLAPGTTYYYSLTASNIHGQSIGAVRSFKTPVMPVVTTLPAGGVASTSATLNGTVYPLGTVTMAGFVWGASPGLGTMSPFVPLVSAYGSQNVSNTLTGLTPGTTYYYAVAATNSGGLVEGAVRSFTTANAPVAVTLLPSEVTGTSATFNGTVYPQGSATAAGFVWGTTASLGTANPSISLASAYGSQNVSNAVTGLTPGTTYYYAVTATNAGGAVEGAVRSFTTTGSHLTHRDDKPVDVSLKILGATALPDGAMRVDLIAAPGQTYVIEAASDPGSASWTAISTNTAATDGGITFTDVQNPRTSSRFYRLRISENQPTTGTAPKSDN